jgi:hypothetical protein
MTIVGFFIGLVESRGYFIPFAGLTGTDGIISALENKSKTFQIMVAIY